MSDWRIQYTYRVINLGVYFVLFSYRLCRLWRPDSTTAKFFVRNCLCEIRMVAHEQFFWILSLVSLSQWVELISTHWRSEIFSRELRIQWNYSRATIRISHKQFLVKNFAAVESGLDKLKFLYNDRGKNYSIHVSLCLGSGEEENNATKAKTRFALQTNWKPKG